MVSDDDAWSPRPPDPGPPPIALPGYRDFVLVASGGDSLVYRAVQEGVNRPVAVKVLVGEAEGVPAARYQRELEITVRLGRAHPNIVTVLDTQILPDGRPCIVMEYYELGSLQDQLRAHGPLPSSAVVAAGTVVADALAYAHREGVLHRDVKPQNILVLPTSYVLADFGLARRIDAGHTSSLERFSYRHASPQVLDGELPTVADDIYSLGSTLFTLLDGRPPFAVDEAESDSALAYLRRVRSELPRPIRSSDATPELLAIIDRCLAKRREDRFPDAARLCDALRGVVTEARVWARAWQPQQIPGRQPVVDSPPAESPPAASSPAASAGVQTPAAPAVTPSGPRREPLPGQPRPVSRPAAPVPGRSPVRHWSTEPPTPRIITPAPAAGHPYPAEIPGPDTAPQPVIAPDRPPYRDGGRSGDQRYDRNRFDNDRLDNDHLDNDRVDDGEYDNDRGAAPDRARGGWVRILVLAAVALLLGTGIGVGGSWLLAVLRSHTGVQTVPTFTGPIPSDAITGVPNPALAPEITGLTDSGASVELVWQDPTDGQASFVIKQIDENSNELFVQSTDPGITRTVIAQLDPAAARYCFQVVAISVVDGDVGISDTRCIQR